MKTEYCRELTADGSTCDRPTKEGREFCWAHYKRRQRRKRSSAPIGQAQTPAQRLDNALADYSAVGTDSEDDQAFEAARAEVFAAAVALGGKRTAILITRKTAAEKRAIVAGMAAAKARGVHVGRPCAIVLIDLAVELCRSFGQRAAARQLGIGVTTLQTILRRHGIRFRRPKAIMPKRFDLSDTNRAAIG